MDSGLAHPNSAVADLGWAPRNDDKKAAAAGAFSCADSAILLQRPEPVVHVLVDLVLGKTVALLQLAFELLAAAFDHVEIVVGELAPLLLGRALELLPVAFNPVPVHRHLLLS